MKDLKLLDKGATADIYEIEEGKVFKKFHNDKPDCSIENEYFCTNKVQTLGLGAPRLYERVNDQRGRGFIMEYINGKSLLNMMLEEKENIEDYMVEWARLHYKVNSIHGIDLPSAHDVFLERIRNSSTIKKEEVRQRLIQILDSLPRNDCLCHTDLHPGNIMVTQTQYRIIDWCDTMSDSNWMDVARIMIMSEETNVPEGLDAKLVASFRQLINEVYLKEYIRLAGESKEELACWMAVFAAVKLDYEDKEDIPVLEKIIQRVI